MDCIVDKISSWNFGGIITEISPVQKTIDDAVDKVDDELALFT